MRTADEIQVFNRFLNRLVSAYEMCKDTKLETGKLVSAVINEFRSGELKANNRRLSFLPEKVIQNRINDCKQGLRVSELSKKWGISWVSTAKWIERHRMQIK